MVRFFLVCYLLIFICWFLPVSHISHEYWYIHVPVTTCRFPCSHMLLNLALPLNSAPFHSSWCVSTRCVLMRAFNSNRLNFARSKSEITWLDFCDIKAEGAKFVSWNTQCSRCHYRLCWAPQ